MIPGPRLGVGRAKAEQWQAEKERQTCRTKKELREQTGYPLQRDNTENIQ